ncbi:MAG: peptidoglycan DD-metalloendopeptidase family protein [Bacteroidaceae bacterium]|nr:peptidoglycan DD-metalloendopeptidase family protein [Bacteroidaceae bacterium]
MKTKMIKKFIFMMAIACVATSGIAQDKLASMAPVDKKMRTIDSLSIVHLLQHEEVAQAPASALYPEWNNVYTTHYGVEIPEEYKIDLRGFHMPADSRLVTSHFGYRKTFHRNHYGTDIKVYVGDTIRAAFSGKIRIVAYEGKGYGRYVIIRHSNGLETLYGHMSKQLVKEDQMVKAGEPIGLGGNTGRSTGAHLHFETRFLGQFINPEKLFNFEMQDVKADYYVYRSNGSGSLMNATGVLAASETEDEVVEDKVEESRNFQQQRIAAQKAKPRTRIHKVQKGESLSSIAKKYKTSVSELCRLNGITQKSTLRVGQILKHS